MNEQISWYAALQKPFFAPPSWLFGPVWSVLYIIIALSFGYVILQAIRGQLPWFVALPFILNIIFNLLFTPLQFGLRSNLWATIDIVFVLGTLIWALIAVYPYAPWVSYSNLPYLAWVGFATVLQFSITYLNW